ncbi:MAG: tetratricopeptide repeat protein [Chloroflexi bacterium]|nr:tetratricopeptide repeat protein [Chloroflexota bacterium]
MSLAGYGYPTQFLLQNIDNGQRVLTDNPRFTWRFMPPRLSRSPQPIQLPADKPAKTCRIFVFGESAAMGDPDPAFGFSRIFQVLLAARWPDRQFEVINTAFPASNSHIIREIARDCSGRQGDFWVVYMGNNEALGAYGATAAFGASAPGRLTIRAGLFLKEFRTGQLLADWAGRMRPPGPQNSEELMETLLKQPVRQDDPVLPRIYNLFEDNLETVLRAAGTAGARVLVNTMVSNLKDCGPFMPGLPPALAKNRRLDWERQLQDGARSLAEGSPRQALDCLSPAAQLDDRHAELQFQLGRACLALAQTNEARQHLEAARDLDGFRARADSTINQIIRRAAARHQREGVRLIDAERAFSAASPGGVTGDELLCEHVHLRFEGNYLLARLQADAIAAWLPPSPGPAGGWLSQAECARRLGLTDWHRGRFLSGLRRQLSGALFQRQSNRAEREGRLRQALRSIEPANRPEALPKHLTVMREALQRSPRDWVLHDQLGKLLLAFGDRAGAAKAWSNVVQIMPNAFIGHYQLGLLLNQPATAVQALEPLLTASELRPQFPEVCAALGTARSHLDRFAEADRDFDQAIALDAKGAIARVAWAESLSARGQAVAARAQLEQAVATNTNSLTAHLRLANLLAGQNETAAATRHFREVLRLDPRNEPARRFLSNSNSPQP